MVKRKSSWNQIVKHSGPTNQSVTTRNLQPQDLGAVIFGCTNNTIAECHSRQLFGLPRAHLPYVQNIKEGLPLFLFNYDDRRLHGIYEATSSGKFCPQSNAWSHNGKGKTGYPAQVAMQIRVWCFPLAESQFRNAILTNYFQRMPGIPGQMLHLFQFELDHAQTHALMHMFTPLPSPNNFWMPPISAPGHEHVRKSILPFVRAPECESNNDLKSEKVVNSDMVKKKRIKEVGTGGVNAEHSSSSNESLNGSEALDCGGTLPKGEEHALSNRGPKVQQQSGQQDKELSFNWVLERPKVLSAQQRNSDFCGNATATEGTYAYSCKDVQEVNCAVLDGQSNLPENFDAKVDDAEVDQLSLGNSNSLMQSSAFKYCMEAKVGNTCTVNKLLPIPPAMAHQFQGAKTQLMQRAYQTPNNNYENYAPRIAASAACPPSHFVEFMSTSSSQEPLRDDDFLHKGRKWKTTSRAMKRSPNGEIPNMLPTELPCPDYVSQYVKDRLTGTITCMVCGEKGHYTCECLMKDRVKEVICTLCNKAGHCHLWCCRQNVSENHACRRCGEKGHYSNKNLSRCGKKYSHKIDVICSSCDTNHPLGKCPMGKITCFLCEGKDHVPAQCHLSPMLTAVMQYHRESFQAILKQAMTESSRRTVMPVKPSRDIEPHDGNHECQFKRDDEVVPDVSNFSHSSEEGHCKRKSPIRTQVPDYDKTSHVAMTDKALALASRLTCFNCHEEGHYANRCPKKKPHGESELHDVTCFNFHANRCHKKKPEGLGLHDVICFNCGDRGHYSYNCPKNKLPGELELHDVSCFNFDANRCHRKKSGELELRDITCFNCGDKGHYANSCPKKLLSGELEPYDGTHECKSEGDSKTIPKVSSFNHSAQSHCGRKSPIRSQVPDSDMTNHATMTGKTLNLESRIPCFKCHGEGHFAKRCPKKKAHRKLDLCDVTCFNCHGNHYTIKCPKRPGELELCDITCFNCYDRGHYGKNCPKKKPLGELEPCDDDSRKCQVEGGSGTMPKVSRFGRCEQDHCDRKGPIKSQVPSSENTNPEAMTEVEHTRVSSVPCFNCDDEGRYAKSQGCKEKKVPRESAVCICKDKRPAVAARKAKQ